MNTTETLFPGYPQENPIADGEYTSKFARYLDKISSITTESIHVLDIRNKQFCYICPNDLILCGYSIKDALKDRGNFIKKIVYPADYTLWVEMHKAIVQYLKTSKEKWDEIDCFSCTFRLQRKYRFINHPLAQMIFLRIKPEWEDGEWRYLICTAGNSTAKEAGNLRMYHKDGSTYEAYHFNSGHWEQKTIEPLTEYEKAILILAGQSYNIRKIAYTLCKGYHTVCNQIKRIYFKLKVHSMQEAIELSNHYRMLYIVHQDIEPSQPTETTGKKIRDTLTDKKFQRIQQHLNDGKSIRQTAKQEGITEGTIRYWIKQEKLKMKACMRK